MQLVTREHQVQLVTTEHQVQLVTVEHQVQLVTNVQPKLMIHVLLLLHGDIKVKQKVLKDLGLYLPIGKETQIIIGLNPNGNLKEQKWSRLMGKNTKEIHGIR